MFNDVSLEPAWIRESNNAHTCQECGRKNLLLPLLHCMLRLLLGKDNRIIFNVSITCTYTLIDFHLTAYSFESVTPLPQTQRSPEFGRTQTFFLTLFDVIRATYHNVFELAVGFHRIPLDVLQVRFTWNTNHVALKRFVKIKPMNLWKVKTVEVNEIHKKSIVEYALVIRSMWNIKAFE